MYHLSEAYLMAGYICLLAGFLGALCYGFFATSPQSAGLHRFAVLFAMLLTAICALGSMFSAVPVAYAALLVAVAGLMTLLFFAGLQVLSGIVVAQQMGDAQRLSRLRWLDNVLIAAGVITGLLLLVGLVYVLPGQFTFWPTTEAGLFV